MVLESHPSNTSKNPSVAVSEDTSDNDGDITRSAIGRMQAQIESKGIQITEKANHRSDEINIFRTYRLGSESYSATILSIPGAGFITPTTNISNTSPGSERRGYQDSHMLLIEQHPSLNHYEDLLSDLQSKNETIIIDKQMAEMLWQEHCMAIQRFTCLSDMRIK